MVHLIYLITCLPLELDSQLLSRWGHISPKAENSSSSPLDLQSTQEFSDKLTTTLSYLFNNSCLEFPYAPITPASRSTKIYYCIIGPNIWTMQPNVMSCPSRAMGTVSSALGITCNHSVTWHACVQLRMRSLQWIKVDLKKTRGCGSDPWLPLLTNR